MRPVLSAIDFTASQSHAPLIEGVDFLKEAFGKGKSLSEYSPKRFPIRFIPDNTKRYLYEQETPGQKRLLVDRYEFLVYRLLRNGLEAGDIFCWDSVRFRSFEAWVECEAYRNHNLIDDQQWQEKEKLIADTGLSILNQPIKEHLAMLEQMLEARIAEVNRRIAKGLNKHVKIKKHGQNVRWTLTSPRSSEPANHPLFDTLRQVEISSVMNFVNQQCGFMESFEHVLLRYVKQEVDENAITACLIAWGTNMGIGRMAGISDIGYQVLSTTSDNFIRLETLRGANDLVSNATAKLPIFRYYDIGEALHSSSDGQKFETQKTP